LGPAAAEGVGHPFGRRTGQGAAREERGAGQAAGEAHRGLFQQN